MGAGGETIDSSAGIRSAGRMIALLGCESERVEAFDEGVFVVHVEGAEAALAEAEIEHADGADEGML